MTIKYYDRVKDYSNSTGTSNFVVSNTPPNGFRTLSDVLSNNDTFYYCIEGPTQWETGIGTMVTGNTFSRSVKQSSSNNNLINFTTGVKNVFLTAAADYFDTINIELSNKQSILGYTPENVTGRVSSFQNTPDNFHYPSEKLVKDNLDLLANASFYATTMTVTNGTLNTGTVSDLQSVGGTDINIQESSGSDPILVTFDFNSITKLSTFVFYGNYNGGSGHQVAIELYNYNLTTWDQIGIIGASTTKSWYAFPIYNVNSYMSSGDSRVRFRHIQSGYTGHNIVIDYLELNYGSSGGSTTIAAASVSFTPVGNIISTNVASALAELDTKKVNVTGIGTAASRNVPTTGDAGSTEVVLGNDSRLQAVSQGFVSDTAYDDTSWDGITAQAPSKNAIRDKIITLAPISGPSFTGTPLAPSGVDYTTERLRNIIFGTDVPSTGIGTNGSIYLRYTP